MVPFRGVVGPGRGHRELLGASRILFLDLGADYVGEFPWRKFMEVYTCDLCIFIHRYLLTQKAQLRKGMSVWQPLIRLKMEFPRDPAIPLPGLDPRELKTCPTRRLIYK